MTGGRLVHLARIDRTECDLHGRVAVTVGGAHLGDDTGPSLDDGDRDDLVVVVPHLRHAELLAQYALNVGTHRLLVLTA